MRLTADLIARSPAFFNPMKDREIDLRGNSIAVIENLAATQDQFDSIDLSDNEIRKVECMAVLRRLTQLLLSNNRVTRISESIGRALPKLQTLVLTNNELRTLAELEPLRHVPTLTALSLVDNPVTKVEHYRLYVISLLPKLKVLDFQRVRPAERDAALTRFGRAAQPHDTGAGGPMRRGGRGAAAAPAGGDSLADAPPPPPPPPPAIAPPTAQQKAQIEAAVGAASTLEQMQRIEGWIKTGNYAAIASAAEKANQS